MTATENFVIESSTSLEELWMPFTSNKAFKKAPRMLGSAQGMYYTSTDGRSILDGCAGLWCVNAGHGREQRVRRVLDHLGSAIVGADLRRGGEMLVQPG